MASGKGESGALLAVRVIALGPLLWFLLAGAIGKVAGTDWIPFEAWMWPLIAAPVVLTVPYVMYRRDLLHPQGVPDVRWMYTMASVLFLIANGLALILYSWVAAIPVALSVAILLDALINKSGR